MLSSAAGYLGVSAATSNVTPSTATDLGRELVAAVRRAQLSFLAAALAYYAFVSIIPLALVGVATATVLGGDALASALVNSVQDSLSPEGAAIVESALVSSTGRTEATIVGLATLSWSGLRVFRGLNTAFGRVYGTSEEQSLRDTLAKSLLAAVALSLAVATTIALASLIPLAGVPWTGVAGAFGIAVVLTVLLFPLFYLFPAVDLTPHEALPGTVLAGIGWSLLGAGFGLYAEFATSFQLYGIIGGVLLFATWLYVGGMIVLLGATLNAVLADRQLQQGSPPGDEQLAPMSDTDEATESPSDVEGLDVETADPEEIERLRRELERFEDEIEERTVHRDELESDLRKYVRRRVRRGHARGWGPYLVLLYGTAMTLGAFVYLNGIWAILAMVVVWLSTLGLYALMVIMGLTWSAIGLPSRLLDRLKDLRP